MDFSRTFAQAGGIKSIQTDTFTIGASATGTDTITAVVPGNSIILYGGCTETATANEPRNTCHSLEITNSTTITGEKFQPAGSTVIRYTVIEFNPGVLESVQYGTIDLDGAEVTDTATVSAVVTANSVVFATGESGYSTSGGNDENHGRFDLTSTTVITLTRLNGAQSCHRGFALVEFK